MRVKRGGLLAGLLAGLLGAGLGDRVLGQEGEAPPPPIPAAPDELEPKARATPSPEVEGEGGGEARAAGGIGRETILAIFRDSNPMLWPLAICSVVAVGFTLERFVALRRRRVAPRDFVERFIDRLSAGKLDRERALELCRAHDSAAARVFGHAVRYWGQPAAVIRQAVDADAAGEVSDMKRNVRALNGTATLAPLLGLMGTVIGLIEAFDALGGPAGGGPAAGGPRGEALAHGISLALVATAIGLGIAIFSVVAYFYLLNRVDVLVRDLDEQARRVIELISAENAWATADRRTGLGGGPYDRPRSEGRSL